MFQSISEARLLMKHNFSIGDKVLFNPGKLSPFLSLKKEVFTIKEIDYHNNWAECIWRTKDDYNYFFTLPLINLILYKRRFMRSLEIINKYEI